MSCCWNWNPGTPFSPRKLEKLVVVVAGSFDLEMAAVKAGESGVGEKKLIDSRDDGV